MEILGNGGAFDKVSSSFLIEVDFLIEPLSNGLFLIDCGNGIFEQVKDKKIQQIFITHTHFDHIADLERLVYYNFFVHNLKTYVLAGKKVLEELKIIFKDKFNSIYVNGEIIKIDEYCIFIEAKENDYIETFEVNHGQFNCYGLYLKKNNIIISGDAKASYSILEKIKQNKDKNLIVYHDLNLHQNSYNSVHMCLDDFKNVYKEVINKVEWKFYHTGKEKILTLSDIKEML